MSITASTGAFWDWDLTSREMVWTGAFSCFFDTPPGDTLSVPVEAWRALIDKRDLPHVDAALEAIRAGAVSRVDLAYSIRGPSGAAEPVIDSVFSVRNGSQVVRLLGTVKRAESVTVDTPHASLAEQLLHTETRFRTFVESLPLLAWEADEDGWIRYYNQRWYDYTGTTPEQMEGWGWVIVHDPTDLPRMLKVFRNALMTGQPWEDEFKLRRADGMFRWHLSRATPLPDVHGRIVRWFGTNTDIHDQKLALQERERLLAAEQLLRIDAENATQAKDEFLAVVSHELRSPLNAIFGWAQMLRSSAVPADKRDLAIEKIETNSRFLGQLISDLLDVSRIVTGKLVFDRAPVNLVVIVDAAIDTVRSSAQVKRLEIEHRHADGPALTLANVQRLQQVFTNLLSNAVRFSREGGLISVSTRVAGAEIAVSVEDRGEGIEAAFLPHLFDKFTQADTSTRRRHGGLGLGLAIAKHLTELQDGSIEAFSEGPGRGATFTVRLRTVACDHTPEPALRSPASAPSSLVGIKILAVDDDPEARDVLASLLLACGATVTMVDTVANTFGALRVEIPDAIVSDLSMPDVDGYGLIERLRAVADRRVAAIPVVALTAMADPDSRAKALSRGFTAYLTKPLDAAELSQTVLAIVGARVVGPSD